MNSLCAAYQSLRRIRQSVSTSQKPIIIHSFIHLFIMVFNLKGIQQVLYRNGTPTMYSLIQTLILCAVLSLEEMMLFRRSILFLQKFDWLLPRIRVQSDTLTIYCTTARFKGWIMGLYKVTHRLLWPVPNKPYGFRGRQAPCLLTYFEWQTVNQG